MCSKEARREFGKSGGHERSPCRSHAPQAKPRRVWTRVAEKPGAGGGRRFELFPCPPRARTSRVLPCGL
jgi:hypothetical protein